MTTLGAILYDRLGMFASLQFEAASAGPECDPGAGAGPTGLSR
jgi:hypothetical protein